MVHLLPYISVKAKERTRTIICYFFREEASAEIQPFKEL
jgi:hypothetical protein